MRIASVHKGVRISVLAIFALALVCPGAGCRRSKPKVRPDAEVTPAHETATPVDLAGVVQDSRGNGLPDALVIAWAKHRRAESVVQARSDEVGSFVLHGLVPGTWTLLAEAAGFGTLELDRTVPDASPLTMALEGEGRSLSGVVTAPHNRPQPGAQVVLGGPGLRWPRQTMTNEHGIFSFSGLGLGRFVVRAVSGSLVSAPVNLVIEEETRQLAPVRLSLALGGFVEGRTRDDEGHDLPGVNIDILTIPSDDLPSSCQSDQQGHFAVGPLRPGRYQIFARLEGHVLLDAHEPMLGPGARAMLTVRLARGARVSGQVQDQDGAPLGGVPVSVVGLVDGRDEVMVLPGALPTAAEAAELPAGSVARQGSIRSALTDAQGHFALSGLTPGRSRLDVSPVDKLPLRREPLLLAPGDDRDMGTLVVLTGVVLSGHVLGQDGLALADTQVEARAQSKGTPPIRVTADSQGQFALRVPSGQYTISAQAKGYAPQTIPAVRALSHAEPLEIRLAPQP
jgi:hypothetical protein